MPHHDVANLLTSYLLLAPDTCEGDSPARASVVSFHLTHDLAWSFLHIPPNPEHYERPTLSDASLSVVCPLDRKIQSKSRSISTSGINRFLLPTRSFFNLLILSNTFNIMATHQWRPGRRVIISGGGPGAISAALAFLSRGFDVRVYEKQPECKAIGGAVLLSTPVLAILRSYGIDISQWG